MATATPQILPLLPEVRAQLSSSVAIVSLEQVILELLKNAIDANAPFVIIEADLARGYCSVLDHGNGIKEVDLAETGCLGQEHCKVAL
jgi:DNA mismatch repair protein MLH3